MAAIQCRQYLMQVIGLSTEAQAEAVRDERLTTLDDLSSFDDEGIKTLCASVRKPGGLIPDPNAPPPAGEMVKSHTEAPPLKQGLAAALAG